MLLVSTAMIYSYRSFGYGRHARRWRLIAGAVWSVFPAVVLIGAVVDRNALLGSALFAALWMWPAYTELFRRVYEIRVWETGRLEFEAPLRTLWLAPSELISIKRSRWSHGDQEYLAIRHRGGKFWVAWPVYDFGDFLIRLSRLNPAVLIEAPETLAPELPDKPRSTAALPADEAPWGHDGIPTVREAARAHPAFASFVWFFPLCTLLALFQETHDNLWPYLFIPLMPAMWWLLIWLCVRGWIRFDD
jgi:hypothetical protein